MENYKKGKLDTLVQIAETIEKFPDAGIEDILIAIYCEINKEHPERVQ